MTHVHTTFDAASNGFDFVNSFTLPFPTTIQLPIINQINLESIVYLATEEHPENHIEFAQLLSSALLLLGNEIPFQRNYCTQL